MAGLKGNKTLDVTVLFPMLDQTRSACLGSTEKTSLAACISTYIDLFIKLIHCYNNKKYAVYNYKVLWFVYV